MGFPHSSISLIVPQFINIQVLTRLNNFKVNVFEIGYGLLHVNKESKLEVSDFTIRNNALDAPQLQSTDAEQVVSKYK